MSPLLAKDFQPMSLPAETVQLLQRISTATITTVLLKKGLRNV